ncbi:ogr/Delta-like zinc finger family protein [Moritella viscosa]|uniref:ogr/Delta-like zinc finger family protein n=1 Tax=Moritella viscosa TaxID=80854 RepID=UPI00406D08E0
MAMYCNEHYIQLYKTTVKYRIIYRSVCELSGCFMRVLCPECGVKSRIQKTNRISNSYTDLYCSCNSAECGHSFVMNLSFSHTLSPSAKSSSQLAFELLRTHSPYSTART